MILLIRGRHGRGTSPGPVRRRGAESIPCRRFLGRRFEYARGARRGKPGGGGIAPQGGEAATVRPAAETPPVAAPGRVGETVPVARREWDARAGRRFPRPARAGLGSSTGHGHPHGGGGGGA